jgi:hypothetical protein
VNQHARNVVLFWVPLTLAVAFFVGQGMAPEATFYASFSPTAISWIGSLPKVVLPGLAAVWALAVARRFERGNAARSGWGMTSAGLFGLFLGQLTLLYFYAVGQTDVFPSIGDLFFVAGCVVLVIGLVLLVRGYAMSGLLAVPARQLVGVAAVSAVAAASLVVPLLLPIARATAPPLEKALNLIYPSLDLLMLIPAVLLTWIAFRFRGGRIAAVWTALAAGVLFTVAGDILWGYFSNLDYLQLGPLIDAVYILAYGCLAASLLYQRQLIAS